MPLITDWLMVAITAIYVIATIIITVANMKSTKTTRDQLMTSIQQYEEKKRLEAMPHLSLIIEKQTRRKNYIYTNSYSINIPQSPNARISISSADYDLAVSNIGWGAAKNINMILNNSIGLDTEHSIYIGAIAPKDTKYYDCTFHGVIDKVDSALLEADFIFEYFDLLGNKYRQIASMKFEESEYSLELKDYSTSDNELVQVAKN